MFEMEAWLDVALLRCPKCGHCGTEFCSKKNATDRAMLEFQLDETGKMQKVNISEHLKL